MRPGTRILRWLALLVALLSIACTPPPAAPPPKASPPPPPPAVTAVPVEVPLPPEPGTVIPVTESEPTFGDPLAPVTWVVWADYECRFCAELFPRIESLRARFGPDKLRVVWRHAPLTLHENARDLAIAAQTVFKLGGAKAFWAFSRLAFAGRGSFTAGDVTRWASEAGVRVGDFAPSYEAEEHAGKIDEDLALAKRVGITGTPASFINGTYVSGVHPEEKFAAVIEQHLAQAKELLDSGVPAHKIYAAASLANFKPISPASSPPPDTTTVWKVPVGKSPVRGKPTALVTIVMFVDFQCPFCRKVQKTLSALEARYGDKLRIVAKMNPLEFHPRAEPAATFALEARKQGGDSKFWEAFNLLYTDQTKLEDSHLLEHAEALHLKVSDVKTALEKHTHEKELDADQDLASDLKATGTPHFFINGRRLLGNQPRDAFQTIIDEEIARAESLLAAGTKPAGLYDALLKDARDYPDPERIVVPAPTAKSPEKGAKAGPGVTTVQVFADFQCPFCTRLMPTLDRLLAASPGKVRIVFRHLPLSMHPESQMAAEAAMEAFAQKGSTGFWSFAALLFEDQSAGALGKEGLLKTAASAGLDVARMRTALENHTHEAEVKADAEIARSLKVTATPSIAVGDYFLAGVQPLRVFKRAVERASGKRVPPKAESIHGYVAIPPPSGVPGMFAAKHIIIQYQGSMRAGPHITRTKAEAKKRAQEVRAQLLKGARFDDLAAIYSDEPGASTRGGNLGTFAKGRMVPEFQTALEATPVGNISDVAETPFGFHVILRTQ